MKHVMTIKGLVSPQNLGFTYSHEHLICFPPPVAMKEDPDYQLPDVDRAVAELELFKQAGGGCIVEGTAIDYGRMPSALDEIAQRVCVHIVFCTGFNKGRFYPESVIKASPDELSDLMVSEMTEGIGRSMLRPGFIKCGASYNLISPQEEKVTIAAARAHRATGAPIWVHTEAGTMGLEQLDILEREGADLSRVCIGHLDRNADLWYHKKIAARGAYVGYDGPGKVKYYPDSVRVELIEEMLESGYGHRLLISGDMGRQSYLTSYGGGPGFQYIIKSFVLRLKDEGLTDSQIEQIWVRNPAEWLAF